VLRIRSRALAKRFDRGGAGLCFDALLCKSLAIAGPLSKLGGGTRRDVVVKLPGVAAPRNANIRRAAFAWFHRRPPGENPAQSSTARRLVFCAPMQIPAPDLSHAGSERARGNFRVAVRLTLGFVALLWVIELVNWALDVGPEDFGVRPRQLAGLVGILFAPLVHGDFAHLFANSLPLLVLGTAMLYLYPQAAPRVLPAVYFGPGIAVWLFARGSSHLGASGLVYGLVSYIFVAGLIRRDRRAIAASMLVSFMYGALVWGVLPIKRGVSWETHLAAALIGVALALALRRLDVVPRRRYSWEDEADAAENEGNIDA
jgi:membrane associated rhomboid family serine protease